MIPYSGGLILDNTNNYGIVKTETVFGFVPLNNSDHVNDNFNLSKPMEWIFASNNFRGRSLPDEPVLEKPRAIKSKSAPQSAKRHKRSKQKKRHGKGVNKCILKIEDGGEGGGGGGGSLGKKRKRKGGGGGFKMGNKKMMMPLILGILAAKSLLIPIALKALAFLSAKGLMMGFFSTILASMLSLKGMFEHHHGYQNRKDDSKTQVEIIQVPTKSEDHIYYDDHYRRGDLLRDDIYTRGELEDAIRRGDVVPVVQMQNYKRNGFPAHTNGIIPANVKQ